MSTDPYKRTARGRFAKGTKPGPGRPRGSMDFNRIVADVIAEDGYTPQQAVAQVWRNLMRASNEGDTAAGVALLRRFCGHENERKASNVIQGQFQTQDQDAKLESTLPPEPTAAELPGYLAKLEEAAARLAPTKPKAAES